MNILTYHLFASFVVLSALWTIFALFLKNSEVRDLVPIKDLICFAVIFFLWILPITYVSMTRQPLPQFHPLLQKLHKVHNPDPFPGIRSES